MRALRTMYLLTQRNWAGQCSPCKCVTVDDAGDGGIYLGATSYFRRCELKVASRQWMFPSSFEWLLAEKPSGRGGFEPTETLITRRQQPEKEKIQVMKTS